MTSPGYLSHHIRALPPALRTMQDLGFSAGDCLAGTGLDEAALAAPESTSSFTLEQEYRFHRNLLAITGNPLLGLIIGRAYTLQSYGLLGYAVLSAPTLRQAMMIIRNYALLSFTLFTIDFQVRGNRAILRFSRKEPIPRDLVRFYTERDLAAVVSGSGEGLADTLRFEGVTLPHDSGGRDEEYERYFQCPVDFAAPHAEIYFDASVIDDPMPLRDAQTSAMCQQQCQMLLARMSSSSGFVDRVRQLIVARPGFFPDIDYVAEKLNMTSRTLRRRLAEEDSGYQQILDELRHELALEYLATSRLPLEEIAALLGYSTPGNFSHAFKRWQGIAPSRYRREAR